MDMFGKDSRHEKNKLHLRNVQKTVVPSLETGWFVVL